MATYTKTILGNLGADSRTVKNVAATLSFTGGMVAPREFTKTVAGVMTLVAGGMQGKLWDKTMGGTTELVAGAIGTKAPIIDKSILGALGSAVNATDKATEPAVLGLTGSMAKSMIYGETMAGDYPPLVWMDDFVKPPTLTFTGSMARAVGNPPFNKTVTGALDLTGTMLRGTEIGKATLATVGLSGGMVGDVRIPIEFNKAVQAELTFTVPTVGEAFAGTRDGRRSLRWIGRRRRRDVW